MISRGLFEHPIVRAVVPAAAGSGSVDYFGCRRGAQSRLTFKEMVPIGFNTLSVMRRSAGRVVAASSALAAYTCVSPPEGLAAFRKFVVGCLGPVWDRRCAL